MLNFIAVFSLLTFYTELSALSQEYLLNNSGRTSVIYGFMDYSTIFRLVVIRFAIILTLVVFVVSAEVRAGEGVGNETKVSVKLLYLEKG